MPRVRSTDYQRSKLYKVERIWWKHYEEQEKDVYGTPIRFATLQEAQTYGNNAWRFYKKRIFPRSWLNNKPLRMKKTIGNSSWAMNTGGYYTNKKGISYVLIKLSIYHMKAEIALHEVAHHLAPKKAHHGGIFTKIYMLLLAQYLGWNLSYMCKIANEHNLDYHSNDEYLNSAFNRITKKEIEEEAKKLQGVA